MENAAYDPASDRNNLLNYSDTRKSKLTLSHINKLRKMRELKKMDMLARKNVWEIMYGIPDAPEEPGF